ncbi:hypothetical protein L6164_004980 [Bauhinia variegata]|uniref:Uncharacterized protein n=1 Tax=Bauhinia variegata TaxID=167791 RepID=A0ACB9PPV9_BAUVA|nr:hypothetical protein L6164_004980 [Bauhinia variegata]
MAAISRQRVVASSLTSHLRMITPSLIRRLGFLSNRTYGSAAAVQYDHDDYEEEYQSRPRAMLDPEGLTPERGVQWVMIGEPGSKRHVFAGRLSRLLEVPHISMGSLVRQELSPRSAVYQQIANSLSEGKLVPEEIIFGLLSKRLEEGYYRGETGFILDGIPRSRIQAEILDQIVHVDLVVNFKCTEENLVNKNLGTGKFTPCQKYLRMGCSMTPTKQLQNELESRRGSSCEENVHSHAEEGKLLEDYYRKQKKLLNFEVSGASGDTWQGLLAALHLQHINATTSSPKLTA